MNYLVIPSILLVLATSCKKDTVPTETTTTETESVDTIFPGDYFPAYPGSYWSYTNEEGEITMKTTEPVYVLNQFAPAGPFYRVPSYDGQFVNTYVLHDQNHFVTRLLPAEVVPGATFPEYTMNLFGPDAYVNGIVRTVDTTMTVAGITFDSVVAIDDIYSGNITFLQSKTYYAKHVGMIRKQYYLPGNEPSGFLNIVSYSINH